MRRKTICLVIIFSISLFLATVSLATTYYVDGARPDDSGNGKTWDTAKKTISSGITLLNAGDTLEISGGTSSKTYVELVKLGGIHGGSDYITIKRGSDPGHNGEAIIANEGSNWVNIWIHGRSSYIKIENITVDTDADNTHAVYIYESNYIQVNNCKFTGTSKSENIDPNNEAACIQGMGNAGTGKYCEIKYNIILAYFDVGIDLNNGGERENKYNLIVGNTVTGFDYCGIKIRKNQGTIIANNYVSGPWRNTNSTEIFLLRNSHYNHVYNNIGEFTHSGSEYQHYVELRGFTGCGYQGNAQSNNNFIFNNTFCHTTGNEPKSAIWFADDSSNNVFQNNIFQGRFTYFTGCWDNACSRPGNIIRNNIITGTVTNWQECSAEMAGLTVLNNKESTSANWFESGEKPGEFYDISKSQDGISSSAELPNGYSPPSIDYDYNWHLRSSPPDIGAFEFHDANPSDTTAPDPPTGLTVVQQ